MKDLTLVFLAAGSSSRFKAPVKKHWLRVGSTPLWKFVTQKARESFPELSIIIAASRDDITLMHLEGCDEMIIQGGATRQESLKNALSHVHTPYVITSDVARGCFDPSIITHLYEKRQKKSCIIPTLGVSDTVLLDGTSVDRTKIELVQTPQLSCTVTLKSALETSTLFTDDSSAIKAFGGDVITVCGDSAAHKLTTVDDLKKLPCLLPPTQEMFVGNGLDIHPFEEGKQMVLGGVAIPCEFGFKAHSDGDVAIHSLIDALLGAACLGDIGTFFPDNDPTYKGIDSKKLLTHCVTMIRSIGFEIVHADLTIIAQTPRLEAYKGEMKTTLSSLLGIASNRLNIKATTAEKLGFIGRKEGVAVMSSATLRYFDWRTL